MSEWNYYLQIAISFFAIAAPVGAILIFISLTENHSEADRRRAARIAALSVALVLITSLLAEQSILHFFGINIASFRIAGGIVIMIMVIAMIQARHSRVHHAPESPVPSARGPQVPSGLAIVQRGAVSVQQLTTT